MLWTVQILLALLFGFAGVVKLTMPPQALAQVGLPVGFMRFIAVAEVAGALGLVLPGLFRIRRDLTPIAATGLVTIMTGAVVVSLPMGLRAAAIPAVVGVLLVTIIQGRREWVQSPRAPRGIAREAHPKPAVA